MNHPSDATLALYAGGDLGLLARWRTERHLAGCERCREEVEAYSDMRADAAGTGRDCPTLHWNRLAAEMKANIRLGLAAGECVREPRRRAVARVRWFGSRALVSYASIAALLVASVLLERPVPQTPARDAAEVTLRATSERHRIEGRRAGAEPAAPARRATVTSSVGAQGSMRARYVDSETGYVTINNVYAQ